MGDPTADMAIPTVEASLYNNVQAVLKGMKGRSSSQKGMLRWSLQKRMESDPSCSASLVQVLVDELEKKFKRVGEIPKTQSYMHVIPVLHILYYVVIQAGAMIPTSLYQTVRECLMKLLTLPSPYSAVALSTLRSIKMEMTTPGSLYERRVVAEQNLRTEPFTLQERVFVLADPAVFSPPLEATVRAHLEVSGSLRNTLTVKKNVVLRVLQTGLGTTCQSSRLTQALETLEDHMVEKYFREVVQAVDQSIKHGAGGHENYLSKLQDIYRDISTSSKEITKVDHGCVCSTAMPFPEINFHLWKDEDDLRNLLADFARCCFPSSVDKEEMDKRHSVQSADSGIEKDLKENDFDETEQHPVRTLLSTRRNAFRNTRAADTLTLMRDQIEAFPGCSPVLKEDRGGTQRGGGNGGRSGAGKTCQGLPLYSRVKRLNLTKRLKLHWYYIAVTDVEALHRSPDSTCQDKGKLSLASSLGRVDPWYNININSLGAAISNLPGTHPIRSQPSELNTFLLDTLCYYLRCGTQPVNVPLYSVKMTRTSCDVTSVVEEVFVSHLEADIPEFRHLKEKFSKDLPGRQRGLSVLGAVLSVSYTKVSLSKREIKKGDAPMMCGVVITSEPAAVTSGDNYLIVRFDSLTGSNTKIRTQNISIKMLEHRTLFVRLDRDARRTYTDVQRIEITSCLDPGCKLRSRFSISSESHC